MFDQTWSNISKKCSLGTPALWHERRTHQFAFSIAEHEPCDVEFVEVVATDLISKLMHLMQFVNALYVCLVVGCMQILARSKGKQQ